jgi:murein DD-endopeptidase MepM/ murein hydrolase activator NlpD
VLAIKFVFSKSKLLSQLAQKFYQQNSGKWRYLIGDQIALARGVNMPEKKRFMYQFTMATLGIFMISSLSTQGNSPFETGGALSHAGYVGADDLQAVWSFETLVADEGTDFIMATGSSTQNSSTNLLGRTEDAEHLVKPGEDLGTIAEWYGLSNVETIMLANNLDNASVAAGTRLKIPAQDGFRYQVKKGDNLSIIAKRFGMDESTLSSFNALKNGKITVGQNLFVPDKDFSAKNVRKIVASIPAEQTPTKTTTATNTKPKTVAQANTAKPVTVTETRRLASPVLDIPQTSGPALTTAELPKNNGSAPTFNAVTPKNSGGSGVSVVPAKVSAKASVAAKGNWFDPLNGAQAKLTQGYHGGHLAVDLALRGGTGIYAAGGGEIIESVCGRNGYGCHVIIQHDNGYRTLYAHMIEKSTYNVGDTVAAGSYLGWMGSTGWSTGTHLHFEIVTPEGIKANPIGIVW